MQGYSALAGAKALSSGEVEVKVEEEEGKKTSSLHISEDLDIRIQDF
jgi:hypothetical protein